MHALQTIWKQNGHIARGSDLYFLYCLLHFINRAINESDSSRCDNTNNIDNSILYHSDYCVWSCAVEKEEKW